MKRTYKKPFGTFELEIARVNDEVTVKGTINGSAPLYCRFRNDKKAVEFATTTTEISGMQTKINGCLLPDYDEVYALYNQMFKDIENEKINEVKSGTKKIEVSFHDGEYLSGYTTYGKAADLLEAIHAAKYVDGWGTRIPDELVSALGKEFTYEEAAKYMQPINDAREAKKSEATEKRNAIFTLAKKTGSKQLLMSWPEDCNDPKEACSLDMVYEYAMPDGSVKTERTHTW